MDEVARRLCEAWGFAPSEEIVGGYCSHVYANATHVLKVPWRGEEASSGYRATMRLQGRLGPRVLHGDPGSGAVLMERLLPGTPLGGSALADDERIAITCGFLRELAREDPTDMMPMSDYYVQRSPQLEQLLAQGDRACFLHGDLHPFNILAHGEGWVPIDPKGIVGDPCFEPIAFLRNCIDVIDAYGQLARRIDAFATQLALDPERIAAWLAIDMTLDSDHIELTPGRAALQGALRSLLRDRGWHHWWP